MRKKLVNVIVMLVYIIALLPSTFVSAASVTEILQPIAVSNASGKLNISWINPENDNVSSIDVVDETGTTVVPTGTTLSTGSKAINSFAITGLSDGTLYNYTVKYTVAGTQKETKISGTPLSNGATTTVTHNGYDAGVPMTRRDTAGYFLDNTEKAEGTSSLKVVSNYGKSGNHAVVMEPNGAHTLDANKEYKLTFKVKLENYNEGAYTNNDQRFIKMRNGGTDILQIPGASSGQGWKDYEITLENQSSLRFGMVVQTQATIWLDDVKLYELDSEGNVTGDNLITWGGLNTPSIDNELVVCMGTTARISWKNPVAGIVTKAELIGEDGSAVSVEEISESFVAGEYSYVKITLPELYTEYDYTIKLTMSDNSVVTKNVTVKAMKSGQYITQDGINISTAFKSKLEDKYNEADIGVWVLPEVKRNGNYGLKMSSNDKQLVKFSFEASAGGINLDTAKSYRVSVWAKLTNDVDGTVYLCQDNNKKVTITPTNEWTEYTFDITGIDRLPVKIFSEATYESLCLDDFAIYELNEENQETGKNLLGEKGGFESVSGVKNISFAEVDGKVTATYELFNYDVANDGEFNPTLILASYNEMKNLLLDCQYIEETIEPSFNNQNKTRTVDYTGSELVKAFVWNGSTLIPLIAPVIME